MRIVFVHPNYHSGGAEIAGNWSPAWVAYLAGSLKRAGFDDIHFVDAMTHHIDGESLRQQLAELQPDLVGVTAITPSIYAAEEVLSIAQQVVPNALRVLGGVHATFMYPQVLSEAPWVDVIVRGEGEEIMVALAEVVRDGTYADTRHKIKGLAFVDGSDIVATPAAPTVKNLDGIDPDWSLIKWESYIYIPLGVRVAIPNLARGCPFTCSFCSQWKFWRDYRVRDPKRVVDEIEDLVTNHGVGFFILADEEPTINRKKFIEFCQELIDRGLNKRVKWGINTRVTDIYRDRELLKFYREAGLVHVSLGTEAAAQLKLDMFNKETTVAENKEAIRLLREADIFTEAQFIVGLDNETAETLEETYKMAWDWQPDLANWSMYTPWPFTPLFKELGDKVEVFDFSKYNFVTPIMKPEAMTRGELLDGVMKNYRRLYMKKALFHYPWRGTGFRRRYLLGCLKAFLKAGVGRTFYDLGKAGYWGPQTKNSVDFHFDETRKLATAQLDDWEAAADRAARAAERREAVKAQMKDRAADRATGFKMPNGAEVKACGGGKEQMQEPAESAMTGAEGRIGPNAILQLVDVLDRAGRSDLLRDVLARSGVARPPTDAPMLPQGDCAAVHLALREQVPDDAPALLRAAGLATGDYILAHRIPKPAQAILRILPAGLAAPVLSRAIAQHAWSFAGTGRFSVVGQRPLEFTLADNPPRSLPDPRAMLTLIKPITWFPPTWAYLCGAVSSGVALSGNWPMVLLGMVLAGPIVCGISQAANDWCDRHVDAINDPDRPIPSGRIPGRWGLWIALAMTALSLCVGWVLGLWGFGATLVGVIAAWAYSAEPVRLKRSGWWGPGLVGLSYEGLPWFTGAAVLLANAPGSRW